MSVTIHVAGEAQPTVAISTQLLEFQSIAGGINPTPQALQISNAGSGPLAWRATSQTTTGGDWLAVSAIFVSVNPRALPPGVYRGRIQVADQRGSPPANAAVNLTVASPASSILLSNTGFRFTAVEGGAGLPGKQFSVLNAGEGIRSWSVVPSTTSGGNWLQATPSGGSGAILDQDFSENTVSRPAARGSVIQVFAAGLGATNPPVPSGRPAPGSPPATTVIPVQARIGGLPAAVQFAGLAPGFVGLYQVNVTVPGGVQPGPNISLELIQNGTSSNTVIFAVQ